MVDRLSGSCESVASIGQSTRLALYAVFANNYADVSFARFQSDFEEKDFVILLRDDGGAIRGFSTIAVWTRTVERRRVRLLFSGDTIIDGDFRGEQVLGKVWSSMAGRLSLDDPGADFYWLLLSKGYRTYLYLPLFFHQYYPRHDAPTPRTEGAVLDDFGRWKYGADYDPRRGVIAFTTPHGRLRPDLADVPKHRLQDEHVRFFLSLNEGYRKGDELVCLARLDAANMKGYARRCFLAGREAQAAELALEGIA